MAELDAGEPAQPGSLASLKVGHRHPPLHFNPAQRYYLGMGQMVHGVDPANNEALAELERKTGPNNFYRAMAHKPDVMAGFSKVYGSIMGLGSLDRKLKEMVYLAVSTVNECKYCTAAHLEGARKAGLSEREIEDIESETNQHFSPAQQAALHYAREMTRACADEFGTREHLQQYFSEEQLVELTLVVALANFTNRFNNGLNVQVENEMVMSTPLAR
jgi:uncharacterized peroxidase-related enzyme